MKVNNIVPVPIYLNQYLNKKILFLFVSILLIILCIILISQKQKMQHQDNVSTTRYLEALFPEFERLNLIYFRNGNGCEKLIYSSLGSSIWVAEPRNYECGSINKYTELVGESRDIFEWLRNSTKLQIKGDQDTEIKIEYDINSKVKHAEFFFKKNHFGIIGYVYEPNYLSSNELDKTYHEAINDNWYAVRYHPSPF